MLAEQMHQGVQAIQEIEIFVLLCKLMRNQRGSGSGIDCNTIMFYKKLWFAPCLIRHILLPHDPNASVIPLQLQGMNITVPVEFQAKYASDSRPVIGTSMVAPIHGKTCQPL